MKIQWWKSPEDGKFYFQIRARNGRIVCVSKPYGRTRSLLQTAEQLCAGQIPCVWVPSPETK